MAFYIWACYLKDVSNNYYWRKQNLVSNHFKSANTLMVKAHTIFVPKVSYSHTFVYISSHSHFKDYHLQRNNFARILSLHLEILENDRILMNLVLYMWKSLKCMQMASDANHQKQSHWVYHRRTTYKQALRKVKKKIIFRQLFDQKNCGKILLPFQNICLILKLFCSHQLFLFVV